MQQYIVSRLTQIVIVMLIISILTFLIINLSPGGPAMFMSLDFTAEQRQAVAHSLGLDEPIPIRYGKWLFALIRGDFGSSFAAGRPVLEVVLERLPNTAVLAACALVISVTFGVMLGVISATKRYSVYDHAASFISFLGVSIPTFWFGILLILLFGVELRWLPTGGMSTMGAPFSFTDRILHLILPTLVLSNIVLPQVVRFTRSGLVEVLQQDHIRTARSLGFSERVIVYRYALKNALFPVITIIGLILPRLIGGSVIIEQVFAWPGMGRLALTAALGRDYPLVMGITVFVSIVVLFSNFLVDLLYAWLDPRVKYGSTDQGS